MSWYRTQLESFLKTLDVDCETVYDVGGIQNPVKDRVKSWKVTKYEILDIPEYDLDMPYLGNFDVLADVVFCLEVFEYLINPIQAIKNIHKILKKGGVAYISIPFVYPVHNEVELDSLRYTENGFKRICATVGMEAEVMKYRICNSDKLMEYYRGDGMKAARGERHNVTGYIFKVTK